MTADFPNLTVVNHPLVQHKLTWLRSVDTNTDSFRNLLREVSQMLVYEATRDLPTELQSITTPITTMDSPVWMPSGSMFSMLQTVMQLS